jgi:hypothetical protein
VVLASCRHFAVSAICTQRQALAGLGGLLVEPWPLLGSLSDCLAWSDCQIQATPSWREVSPSATSVTVASATSVTNPDGDRLIGHHEAHDIISDLVVFASIE